MASTRIVLAAFCGLACGLLALPASANEPAYVDSPAGRAVPDPARTDGRVALSGATAAAAYQTGLQAEQDAEHARQYQDQIRMIEAQVAAAEQANARRMATQQQPGGYADPPVGGRDLAAELQRGGINMGNAEERNQPPSPGPGPQAGIGTQIGAGLAQDAAGLLDAGIQRNLQGDDGTVVLPPLPPGP